MKESKWAVYDSQIEEQVRSFPNLSYSDLSRQVLGDDYTYADVDALRTYIRRNFGDLREALIGGERDLKILIYDIETSLLLAHVWDTGQQFIGHKQLMYPFNETKIITVAYKYLGSDRVEHLVWEDNNDEKLVKDFLKVYNEADMVIGVNNDRFDNKILNTRAAKHRLYVDTSIRSFDVQKQTRSLFRLPSHSMEYVCKFLGVTHKQSHEGIIMWINIMFSEDEDLKQEYLKKMVDYNIGDIVSTEDIYYALRPYMGHKMHVGVLNGKESITCPNCGGDNIELLKVTSTPTGILQRVMRCKDDGTTFKFSNTKYQKWAAQQQTKLNLEI